MKEREQTKRESGLVLLPEMTSESSFARVRNVPAAVTSHLYIPDANSVTFLKITLPSDDRINCV